MNFHPPVSVGNRLDLSTDFGDALHIETATNCVAVCGETFVIG